MKIKRDKRDDVFSKLIRARAGWMCERCGKPFTEQNRQGLDCSHLYSRRHTRTRWHPQNAYAHCMGCHSALGGAPVDFNKWAIEKSGQETVDLVENLAHTIVHWKKHEKEAIYKYLKHCWDNQILDFEDPAKVLEEL